MAALSAALERSATSARIVIGGTDVTDAVDAAVAEAPPLSDGQLLAVRTALAASNARTEERAA